MVRARSERRERRWLHGLGIGLAVVAVVLVVAGIAAEVLAERYVDKQRPRWSAELSERLQRRVSIGDTDVSVLLGHVRADDIAVGPSAIERKAGAAPPALQATRAQVNVGVLRTLLSFGRRPYVQSITVDGLRANVVKRPDGTFNWQEISERLSSEQAGRAERKEPAREPDERMRNARVGELRVPDARVALVTLGGRARPIEISAVDLRIRNAGYYQGLDMTLKAAVAEPQRNLDLSARVDGKRRDDRAAPPRLRTLKLQLEPVEIAELARFAATGRAPLQRGVLSADLDAESERGGGAGSSVKGEVLLTRAQYAGGKGFDARLDLDLAVARDGDAVTVRKGLLRAGEMQLSAQGKLDRLREAPRVQQLAVSSQGLDFDKLRALYPELDERTAPARLNGPLSISASGKGTSAASNATVAIDLTGAAIRVDDRFDKPAGTPMGLHAQLSSKGRAVEFAPFTLQLADYQVQGRGHIADVRADNPRFSLAIETPSPAAGGLLALLPRVARALPRGADAGSLAVRAEIEGTRERFSGNGQLEVAKLAARSEGAHLEGGGSAHFEVARDGDQLRGSADADFSQLVAVYPGLVNKPERSPLAFSVRWDARGVGRRPEALRVSVPALQARAGRSDVRGSVRVENAEDPQLKVDLQSNYLDPADFQLAGAQEKGAPARGRSPMQQRLAKSDGTIALRAREGTAAGAQFQNLAVDLRLRNGRARANTMQASAFGGSFDGAGSEFPLFAERAPYRIKGKVDSMDVDPVLQGFAGAGGVLQGKLGAKLDVAAEGLTLEELQRTLTGRLEGSVADATFMAVDGETELASALSQVAQIPGLREQLGSKGARAAEGKGWSLKDLAGALRFEKGAVYIPEDGISAHTPQGELRLGGRVGTQATDLKGTLMLEPKALAAMLGTDPGLKEPVPVSLRIQGSIENPQLAFADLGPTLRPVLESYARSQFGAEGERAVQRALEQTGLTGQDERKKEQGQPEKRGAKRQDDDVQKEIEKGIRKIF